MLLAGDAMCNSAPGLSKQLDSLLEAKGKGPSVSVEVKKTYEKSFSLFPGSSSFQAYTDAVRGLLGNLLLHLFILFFMQLSTGLGLMIGNCSLYSQHGGHEWYHVNIGCTNFSYIDTKQSLNSEARTKKKRQKKCISLYLFSRSYLTSLNFSSSY